MAGLQKLPQKVKGVPEGPFEVGGSASLLLFTREDRGAQVK